MTGIQKKYRDLAMEKIIAYYQNAPANHHITPEYLYRAGLPREINVKEMVIVLRAMKYLEYDEKQEEPFIRLTDSGRCYFETEMDKAEEIQKAHRHNWKVAVFSALVGALASKPMWDILFEIIDLLRKASVG